jgi:hypothetical protein
MPCAALLIALRRLGAPGPPAREALAVGGPALRLAAVEELAPAEGTEGRRLLEGALEDEDWASSWRAAAPWARWGTRSPRSRSFRLALEGPTAARRRAAAEALLALCAERGGEKLARKAGLGRGAGGLPRPWTAWPRRWTGRWRSAPVKGPQGKEPDGARGGGRALVRLAGPERERVLGELLAHEDALVRAEAIEGPARAPTPRAAAPLFAAWAPRSCPTCSNGASTPRCS